MGSFRFVAQRTLLALSGIDERAEHEGRDGKRRDDDDETNDGLRNHRTSRLHLAVVSTRGHPQETGVQEVEQQYDSQESESNVDDLPNDLGERSGFSQPCIGSDLARQIGSAFERILGLRGGHGRQREQRRRHRRAPQGFHMLHNIQLDE